MPFWVVTSFGDVGCFTSGRNIWREPGIARAVQEPEWSVPGVLLVSSSMRDAELAAEGPSAVTRIARPENRKYLFQSQSHENKSKNFSR